MPGDRIPQNTPEAEQPELSGSVRPLQQQEVKTSLATKLVPIVDKLRQLKATFGIRPYRVFLVHLLWTGAKPGDGVPTEISRREILPTPRVRDLTSTNEILSSFGRTEEGGLMVDEITAKLSEDDLMGATPDLLDNAQPRTGKRNGEFFWEVIENRPQNPNPIPRRYVPTAAPSLSRDGFQWRVSLTKQNYNRPRGQGLA